MSARLSPRASVVTYLTGFFLTNIGVGGFTLATGLAFYQQTGSASTFGFLVAVEYALGFVGQMVGGSILDRRSVLGVALTSNAVRGTAVLAGGALLWAGGGRLPLVAVFLVSAFIRPLYRSASFVLGRMVSPPEELARVNALRFGLLQAAQLCGLGVVAGLYAVLPPGAVVCATGALLLAGTATLVLLRGTVGGGPERGTDEAPAAVSFSENWRQLGRVLADNPGLRVHLVLGGMPPVVTSLATVLVAPVNDAVHGGSFGIAVLDGSASAGALLTILAVRRLDQRRSALVGVACALALCGLVALAVGRSLVVAGFAFLLLGIAAALGATSLDTLLQTRASVAILGRLSITQECATSVTAIALIPLSGPLLQDIGLHGAALLYGGVIACYLVAFALATATLRDRLFGQGVDPRPTISQGVGPRPTT
ncbi:MFS transporter [Kitasatospora sp. NPDC093550]|uniref:MFS transporter n=1 Tax=Kitasatospora sp. NPDC093550 TaxID=3364089 RepID=UPI0038101853